MKLYGEAVSLFCTRVLLAAQVKGLSLPLAPLPGGNVNSAQFRTINPLGKMPVLEDDGEHLPESEVILEYLEETQSGPKLMPLDAIGRARCRLLARIVDLYVMPPATGFYRNLKPEVRNMAEVAAAEAEYKTALAHFEHFMKPGPFALGSSITLADCALAPLVDVMSGTILPMFDVPDPVPSMKKLGPWWNNVQRAPTWAAMLAQYRAGFRAFMGLAN